MTALEYLIQNVFEEHSQWWYREIEVALAMEKEQIIDAYNEGYRDGEYDARHEPYPDDIANYKNAEQYYKSIK